MDTVVAGMLSFPFTNLSPAPVIYPGYPSPVHHSDYPPPSFPPRAWFASPCRGRNRSVGRRPVEAAVFLRNTGVPRS